MAGYRDNGAPGVGVAMETRGRDIFCWGLETAAAGVAALGAKRVWWAGGPGILDDGSSDSVVGLNVARRAAIGLNIGSGTFATDGCAGVAPAVPRTPCLRFI